VALGAGIAGREIPAPATAVIACCQIPTEMLGCQTREIAGCRTAAGGTVDHAADPAITGILIAMREEPERSGELSERLYRHVYPHLHNLAHKMMANEREGHTLQPTALVNDAFLRLVEQERVRWAERQHFFRIAARIMRRILIDHARACGRRKRGGGWRRVTLDTAISEDGFDPVDLVALDDALNRLEARHPRMARVVELRVFGGLTMSEVAGVLGVSKRTADGDWSFALRWLSREFLPEGRAGS
jgi:RNA polymerase sigma-70 factor (ECF subfamily)